jgi:hypothetical protein
MLVSVAKTFSLRVLLIAIILTHYFAYTMGASGLNLAILFVFSIQILALRYTYKLKNQIYRWVVNVLLLLSIMTYVGTLRISHPNWDAQHFFKDIQSLRQNQSPYSGELSCGMNQNFVPTFALVTLLGDSFAEFQKNLTSVNKVSELLCMLLIIVGLVYFFRNSRLTLERKVEISLQTCMLIIIFHLFFQRNTILGNISSWVAPLILLIMGFHYFRRWVLAGIFLGAAITIKPFLLSAAFGYALAFLLKRDRHSFIVLTISFLFLVVTAALLELIPGGLGLNTYKEFFISVAPIRTLGMMTNISNISAPAAFMAIMNNLGVHIDASLMARSRVILTLAAIGAGAYLLKREHEESLPFSHLAYYLLLSTAISPIVWLHYFSWLIGPAVYLLWKISADEENHQLIPLFLLISLMLTFDSIAWIGSFALPALCYVCILNVQGRFRLAGDAVSTAPAISSPSPTNLEQQSSQSSSM